MDYSKSKGLKAQDPGQKASVSFEHYKNVNGNRTQDKTVSVEEHWIQGQLGQGKDAEYHFSRT